MDPGDGSPSLLNWDKESTVTSLLLRLQALLSNPEVEHGCVRNSVAAKLLKEAPLTYKQMALDCVTASLRVDGMLGFWTASLRLSPEGVHIMIVCFLMLCQIRFQPSCYGLRFKNEVIFLLLSFFNLRKAEMLVLTYALFAD